MNEPINLGLESDEDHPRRLIALPNDDKHLLAFGGNDGIISLVVLETSKVCTARQFDDAVRDVAFSSDGKRVAVGLDDGSTQIFVFTDSDLDTATTIHPFVSHKADEDFLSQDSTKIRFQGPRFDAPVRSLRWDPRSYMLAIASEAGMCVVDATSTNSISNNDRFLQEAADKEHSNAGVRGLSYLTSDSQTLLASLGLDGRLCIWDVTGDDPGLDYELLHRDGNKCIPKADVGELNGSDAFDRSCLPVFGKNVLCLPGNNDVHLRSISKLGEQSMLSSRDGNGHIEPIVSILVSDDNKSIVTSGRDGRVNLWNIEANSDVFSGHCARQLCHFDSVPTHMVFKSNALYIALANGTLASMSTVGIYPEKTTSHEKTDKAHTGKIADKKGLSTASSDASNIFVDDKPSPIKRNKKSTLWKEEEDDDDDNSASVNDEPRKGPKSTMDEDDMLRTQDADDLDDLLDDDMRGIHQTETYSRLLAPQPAFTPSSTPLDLPRRIMCWNHIGTCTLIGGDDENTSNIINIDFTDSAFRRPISFTDNMQFVLGSLGEDGGIFASGLVDDDAFNDDMGHLVDDLNMSERTKAAVRRSHSKRMKTDKDSWKSTGSSIYFHRFETFGSLRDKDWYFSLPDGELVMGCASGEGWAAAVTSRRFLRFFTSGGNQGPILWLKGEPVAVVGRSRFLAVIYHESMPYPDGTQNMGFMLYDAIACRVITSGSLSCISARSTLSWAGFSNDCSLLVMDSDGMLSMLIGMGSPNANKGIPGNVIGYTWDWSPVLDTIGLRKSVDDSFWPVTSQDGKLVCVPLRGGINYPDAGRRPVTTALSLRMPFARGGLKNSVVLEEASVRASMALTQKRFLTDLNFSDGLDTHPMEVEYDQLCANVDKVTLKLFHSTVTAGKLERALDLCNRLHLEKSFDIATRVADMANHRTLADRINEVKERKFPEEEEPFEDRDRQNQIGIRTLAMEEEVRSQHISPESDRIPKRTFENFSDTHYEKSVVRESLNHIPRLGRKTNPFAKKLIESPRRKENSFPSPDRSPSKSLVLSRLSSFSVRSREVRSPKKIL